MPAQGPAQPYPAFNFIVEINNTQVAGFTECSGLEAEVEPVDYREGNEKTTNPRKIPGLAKYQRLTLKRGMTSDNTLFDWFNNVLKGVADVRDVSVILLDETKQPVVKWAFHRAWPCKWTGPTLSSQSNDVAIESLELVHEGFELVEG